MGGAVTKSPELKLGPRKGAGVRFLGWREDSGASQRSRLKGGGRGECGQAGTAGVGGD